MNAKTSTVQVAYSQYYLRDTAVLAEIPDDVFVDGNGLISPRPGIAVVHTGTHTGPVRFTVQARANLPLSTDLDEWDEVVEVSLTAQGGEVLLEEWGSPTRDDLGNLVTAGPGSYRLRIHARGRDEAYALVIVPEEPLEEHLLITWPAPVGEEIILKQTDQYGAFQRGM
jgi:hypothetical protein